MSLMEDVPNLKKSKSPNFYPCDLDKNEVMN